MSLNNLFFFLYILVLRSSFTTSVSQNVVVKTGCTLDFPNLSSIQTPTCEEGNWGGFLQQKCCGSAFNDYLYVSSQLANQTGNVFLSVSEQRNCLLRTDCEIEKLASGTGGGCSDFHVEDVTNTFGDELLSLRENCDVSQPCNLCVKSWEDITSKFSDGFASDEADICRFSVLVTLASSSIENKGYVGTVYNCLAMVASGSGSADERRNLSRNVLVGSLCGGGMLVMMLVIVIIVKLWSKSKQISPRVNAFKDVLIKEAGCPKFSSKEVYSATNNLNESNFIGEGTAGRVYKGELPSKQQVAVKHIVNDLNVETFIREVTSLSHVRHPNLVALLGYCLRKNECFLIYELCPNGNLSEWLFGQDKMLSWISRLEIAIDSARGLWFLHTYSDGCIVHRDIKPTNILLGPNFEAKLSDFGLCKVIEQGETQVSSEVRGTFGYLDPEYQSNHQVNSFGDVYSFGIVLLQILSGKKVINLNLKKPMPLDKMAKSLTKEGSIREFADPKLEGDYSQEAFHLALQLALACTSQKQHRPPMELVVLKLEEALDLSTRQNGPSPECWTP